MRALRVIIIPALALAACRSEPPTATGRLERPAGMAIIERPGSGANGTTLREDLLIADSEAQGVKMVQYFGEQREFLPAPLVFFPLVVPARGFPTEVVASLAPDTDRAYALSPGEGLLHVLDVRRLGFLESSLDNAGYVSVNMIDLNREAPGLIPTDIVVVATLGTTDLVAVSFEGIVAPDQLMLFRIEQADGSCGTAVDKCDIAGTTTVAASPRAIAVRGAGTADVRVLLSSSATSRITEVALAPTAADPIVSSWETEVGGPTGQVVDAGAFGAFAIRIDRPRVVHLIPGADRLMKSNAPPTSPFTPLEERTDPTAFGTVDTRQSPIGAAALGEVPAMIDPNPGNTVESVTGNNDPRIEGERIFQRADPAELLPVLLLAHVDGTISFVVIEQDNVAELADSLTAKVIRVATTSVAASARVQVIDPITGSVVGTCGGVNACEADMTLGDSACPATLVRNALPTFATYRAIFRGDLVKSDNIAVSTTATSLFEITDPAVSDFGERLVEAGDQVFLQVRLACGEKEPEPLGTGVVLSWEGSTITAQFPARFAIDPKCVVGARYEIYPGAEQMVLTRYVAEQIVEVVERSEVQTSTSGEFADFSERLSMRINSYGGSFSCTSSATYGIDCLSDVDCGPARGCTVGPAASLCSRTCGACEESSTACIREPTTRICSRVDVEVFPTVPFTLSAQEIIGNSVFPSAAPAAAVFSRQRLVWVISFPGTRVLVEFQPTFDEMGTPLGFLTFHIR